MSVTVPARRLVLATANQGKLKELRELLAEQDCAVLSQAEFNVESVKETGLTFIENALLKARHAAEQSGLPAVADDSGLVVDALEGRPGIHSARFAGEDASDADNVALLLEKLDGVPEPHRGARFVCAMALLRFPADPTPLVCEGRWEGRIAMSPRGEGGFGYDPVFVTADGRTAAELGAAEKNRLSHRGQAVRELVRRLPAAWPAA